MTSKTLGNLTDATALTGTEQVYVVQSGNSRKSTAQAIADLGTSQDNMDDGTTNKNYTVTEQIKLAGIAEGAEVNVSPDWNATTGDGAILNKPTLREVLTANRTYYVAKTGADTNDGLTAGTAFLTIQKAVNVAAALDMSTYQVTISVGAGTFSETVIPRPCVGLLPPLISGAGSTSTIITGVQAQNTLNGCAWRVENLGFGGSGGYAIIGAGPGVINFANVDFGGTSKVQHIRTGSGFIVNASGNFSISAGTTQQMFYTAGGVIVFASRTITITANVSCLTFVTAEVVGHIDAWSMTFNLGSFSVTGKRYTVTSNGVIHSGGGGASYFPGSAAGDTPSTGGQYL